MPSLTQRLVNLHQRGPVIELEIMPSFPFLKKFDSFTSSIKTIKVLAMIDTGAMSSVIKQGLAQELSISPIGVVSLTTPSSENVSCFQYNISISFPSSVNIESVIVTEAPLQGQHIQFLIGRDVLKHAVFIYNGYDNSFTLSF